MLLLVPYSRRPFFYKSALKYSRLMVFACIIEPILFHTAAVVAEVKAFVRNAQVLLEKQPESIFLLFQALGFMEVAPHPEDSRFRVYAPSEEACREARLMLTALTESLALLTSRGKCTGRCATWMTASSWRSISRVLP